MRLDSTDFFLAMVLEGLLQASANLKRLNCFILIYSCFLKAGHLYFNRELGCLITFKLWTKAFVYLIQFLFQAIPRISYSKNILFQASINFCWLFCLPFVMLHCFWISTVFICILIFVVFLSTHYGFYSMKNVSVNLRWIPNNYEWT